MMKLARTDRSAWTNLMFTVDKWILAAIFFLMASGLFIGYAASPAVAERLELPALHFFFRQLGFILIAIPIILGLALLNAQTIRRIGIVVFIGAFAGLLLVPFLGMEIKGASRWISVFSFSLQPSEFIKPGIIILLAAIFAAVNDENRVKLSALAAGVTGVVLFILVRQPDYGQTSLIAATFLVLLHLSGAPRWWIGSLMGLASAAAVWVFTNVDHVRDRIITFVKPGAGDSYQINLSLAAFQKGGVTGQGIGEGRIKHVLPDAHTDFIFAATAEEFGLFACMALMAAFAVIIWRGFQKSLEAVDPFAQLASAGLVCLFGLQAVVNMGVNMKMLPTKGMTLPLVSYGGSSLLALAITTGMILALTRKRAGRIVPRKIKPRERGEIQFDTPGLIEGQGG